MIKKILGSLIFILFLLFPQNSLAQHEQFSSSYNVIYDVGLDGVTTVTENIVFVNKTNQYFASSFGLSIGATQISDIEAYDSFGPLEVETKKNDKKTEITVIFREQIIGEGKEYRWSLRFKSKDFASKDGKVWQITIPKMVKTDSVDAYALTLAVPLAFGDPTSILPEPSSQSERGEKLQYHFTKEQVENAGIIANFGNNQLFDYELAYKLENNGLLPSVIPLPLPPNTAYQQVLTDEVSPNPENITVDKDGNYIGWFKVNRKSTTDIRVKGTVRLSINPSIKKGSLSKAEFESLTAQKKYWEVANTQIKNTLNEIFKEENPQSNAEKAKLIHRYVSNHLSYSTDRLNQNNFDRLGAVTVLNNPNQALCLEFSDLFVTLSRAAGIPARMLIGYAYTSNKDLRPTVLEDTPLHAWAEYYDPTLGWVMVDPTWESTTGGVDYFSKFDLNHFVLAIRGEDSEEPIPAENVTVSFSDRDFSVEPKLQVLLDVPAEVFSGFPAKAKIRLENVGNYPVAPAEFSISSAQTEIRGSKTGTHPEIPAHGFLEYDYDLRSNWLWKSYDDVIQLKINGQTIDRKITVKPFFAYTYFSYAVVVVFLLMIGIYGIVLFTHFKKAKHTHKSTK